MYQNKSLLKFIKFACPIASIILIFWIFQNCSIFKQQGFESLSSVAGGDFCELNQQDSACTLASTNSDCNFDGQRIPDKNSVIAYLNPTVPYGEVCVSENRTCNNGFLNNSFTFASCRVNPPPSDANAGQLTSINSDVNLNAACRFENRTIPHGTKVIAFRQSTVPALLTCEMEERVCENGNLTGSFDFSFCNPGAPAACRFNNQTIAHGVSVFAFGSSTVPLGSQCVQNIRTCYNGVLSGLGEFATCAINAPASCVFNQANLAHGQRVQAFFSSTVSSGQTCLSETRTCNNGYLSGEAPYASCLVNQPRSCILNTQTTIPHHSSITLYRSEKSDGDGRCLTENRFCEDGTLSGSATSTFCEYPTIEALFNGNARFQVINESTPISFEKPAEVDMMWDQKLTIFQNPSEPGYYYAVTRGRIDTTNNRFNVFLFKSTDGINFNQGTQVFKNLGDLWALYDPHISVDETTQTKKYLMTMECAKFSGTITFGASVCTSFSTTPWVAESWSPPQLVIENLSLKSASTGVSLFDSGKLYLKWTIVDDGKIGNTTEGPEKPPDEGTESSSSWAAELKNFSQYRGYSTTSGQLLLGAEKNTVCTSSWDCNNADVQDWKKIGRYFYAIYNGGNYFRCIRPGQPTNPTSDWAIAIRRSLSPLGPYDESTGPIISSELKNTCGISYPVFNQVGNSAFLYYAYNPANGAANRTMRSRLIWSQGQRSTLAPMPTTPQFTPEFEPGELLIRSGHSIQLDGVFLIMQTDGNLVAYRGSLEAIGPALWSTQTNGLCSSAVNCRAIFQSDGNFVLYDGTRPYWYTNTSSKGKKLVLSKNSPYLSILDSSGSVVW